MEFSPSIVAPDRVGQVIINASIPINQTHDVEGSSDAIVESLFLRVRLSIVIEKHLTVVNSSHSYQPAGIDFLILVDEINNFKLNLWETGILYNLNELLSSMVP